MNRHIITTKLSILASNLEFGFFSNVKSYVANLCSQLIFIP